MLETEKLVPEVYYKDSRDFQFIGRIYDVIFHYMKNTSDLITQLTVGLNDKDFIDLPLLTVGLQIKHNYDYKQARNLVSAFQTILRNKGSLKGINLLVKTILNAEGITLEEQSVVVNKDVNDPTIINIYVPAELADISLLYDVLDYIIPVGMTFVLIRTKQVVVTNETKSKYATTINQGDFEIASKSIVPDAQESENVKPVDLGVARIDNMGVTNE